MSEIADIAPETDPPVDQLLRAVMRFAVRAGRAVAAPSIRSGLPLVNGCIPLEQLDQAFGNAGLMLGATCADLGSLGPEHLPLLALTDANAVLVIDQVIEAGGAPQFGIWRALDGTSAVVSGASLRALRIERLHTVLPHRAEPIAGFSGQHFLARIERGNRPVFLQAILLTIALNVVGLAMPLYTMNVYDRVLPNFAFDTLTALSVGAALAIGFELLLRTFRAVVVDHASTRSDVAQANHLFQHVLGAKLEGRAAPVGLRAAMLREFETLREFRSSLTLATLGDVPFFLLYIGVIAVIAGPLALVALATIPFVFGAALMFHRRQARLTEAGLGQAASRNAVAVETLGGLETIKTIGAESWAATRWEHAVAAQLRTGNSMRLYAGLGINLVNLVQGLATVMVVIAGVHMVARGVISAGALMATMMLLARAMAPVAQMALLLNRLHGAQAARRAIDGFLKAPQERPDGADFVNPPAFTGRICFDKVSFAYAPMTPAVLSELTLAIKPGEAVGLIGSIGSGKSTLMKLLLQLHTPSAGQIRMDDVGLSAIDPAVLRAQIGHVGQDSTLFSGTIRMNLTLHRVGISDGQIIEAARCAMALDWIARLPRGFDTVIGERGAGLSGGQRQTLLLARALVGQPAILLLDEPSSDLDITAERALIQRLKPVVAGRTLIMASHRPAMLDLVDRLIVLENGRVYADGPKAKVLAILQVEYDRRVNAIKAQDAARGTAA